MPRVRRPLIDLFMQHVEVTPDHWLWTGPVAEKDGYPVFRFKDPDLHKAVSRSAHRWFWIYTHGPLPDGWTVDHLCRVIICVKLDHLEPVPHQTNLMRSDTTMASVNARKTHCIHGHEFTPENTYIRKNGSRACKTCVRERGQRYYVTKKVK